LKELLLISENILDPSEFILVIIIVISPLIYGIIIYLILRPKIRWKFARNRIFKYIVENRDRLSGGISLEEIIRMKFYYIIEALSWLEGNNIIEKTDRENKTVWRPALYMDVPKYQKIQEKMKNKERMQEEKDRKSRQKTRKKRRTRPYH